MNGGGGGMFDRKPALSPESAALLDDPNAKLPTVVTTTAANSSIPVLVNDVPITAYDINQRYRLLRLGGGKADQKGAPVPADIGQQTAKRGHRCSV